MVCNLIDCCKLPTSPADYCQSLSKGIYGIPSFPERLFNSKDLESQMSARNSQYTNTREDFTYIFPTGLEGCETPVAKLGYCYTIQRNTTNSKIFEIWSLHPMIINSQYAFKKEQALSITRNRSSASCSNRLCCDVYTVRDFNLTSFAGVSVESGYHLLKFKNVSTSNFLTQQYIVSVPIGRVVEGLSQFCNNTDQDGLLLLKFHFGKIVLVCNFTPPPPPPQKKKKRKKSCGA